MAISLKNDVPSGLPEQMRILREGYANVPAGNDGNGRNAFAGLFMDALRNSKTSGEGKDSSLAPPVVPDKEQIQKLIMKIQVQMYEHLLSAMRGESRADSSGLLTDGDSLATRGLFPPGDIPSKNRQKMPINDGSRAENRFAPLIERAARTYGVDGALIRGVIRAESNFNPRAVSPKGAIGLMQLMPSTAKDLGVADPYDPAENIMGGTRYLKGLLDRYDGDVALALAAYNWGMGNVEKSPDRLPAETRSYIARVSQYYRTAT